DRTGDGSGPRGIADVEIDRLVPVVQVIVDDRDIDGLEGHSLAKGHVAGDRFVIDTVPAGPVSRGKADREGTRRATDAHNVDLRRRLVIGHNVRARAERDRARLAKSDVLDIDVGQVE